MHALTHVGKLGVQINGLIVHYLFHCSAPADFSVEDFEKGEIGDNSYWISSRKIVDLFQGLWVESVRRGLKSNSDASSWHCPSHCSSPSYTLSFTKKTFHQAFFSLSLALLTCVRGRKRDCLFYLSVFANYWKLLPKASMPHEMGMNITFWITNELHSKNLSANKTSLQRLNFVFELWFPSSCLQSITC